MIDKKELKLLMTRVAKGEVSEKDAERYIKMYKTSQKKPSQQKTAGHEEVADKEGVLAKPRPKNAHKRKKQHGKK